MKDIVIHGATYNSNYGDALFAKMFYDKLIDEGFNVDVLQLDKGKKLCDFVRNELDYHKTLSYQDALKKDALVFISGGYLGQNKNESSIDRYNTFIKPLLDFQKQGKKTFIIGAGGNSGLIFDEGLKRLMVEALNNADYVSVRNIETYEYFKSLGVEDIHLTSDTAQSLTNISPIKLTQDKTILISLSQHYNTDKYFATNILPAIQQFTTEHPEYKIVLTTCRVDDVIDNYETVKTLGDSAIIYKYTCVDDLTSVIAGADIVMATTLHFGIVGATLGKSVIIFAGSYNKAIRYYNSIGEEDRCVNLWSTDQETAYSLLNKYYDQYITINENIRNQAVNNLNIVTQQQSKKYICVIVKDEHQYIEEWVDYNLKLGFDKIFIFEDSNSKSHKDVLSNYKDFVEIKSYDELNLKDPNFGGSKHQIALFTWFIKNHNYKNEWCAFIDPDEYIVFKDNYTLDQIIEKYKYTPGIYLNWVIYGANGHIKRPEGSVMDNYTTLCDQWIQPKFKLKSFINFNHYCGKPFDVHKAPGLVECTNVQLNHYFTKSWEDWCFQILERGDLNKYLKNIKNLRAFFKYNPDMMDVQKECYRFLRDKYQTLPIQ